MQGTAALSLDQAPPISIPLRFFLTAPLFAILAAMLALIYGDYVLASRWSPAVLAMTHMLTLGFMSMVMMGAALQILPVLAGAPIPKVSLVGSLSHAGTTLGILLLSVAFISGNQWAAVAGGSLLIVGLMVFILGVAIGLLRCADVATSSVIRAVKLALISLLVTLLLGVMLLGDYAGYWSMLYSASWTDLHLSWGIIGWLSLLFIGVSFHVVPMFQVTPEYPALMKKWLLIALFGLLAVWTILYAIAFLFELPAFAAQSVFIILLLAIATFLLTTLKLQRKRSRKVADVTVTFWRVGMGFAFLALLLLILGKPLVGNHYEILLGVVIIIGAVMSLINGMLYRILPFLSWFHLQHLQLSLQRFDIRLPHMKAFISDRAIRWQFWLHVISIFSIVAAIYFPVWMRIIAALIFAASNSLLLFNLTRAALLFYRLNSQLRSST